MKMAARTEKTVMDMQKPSEPDCFTASLPAAAASLPASTTWKLVSMSLLW